MKSSHISKRINAVRSHSRQLRRRIVADLDLVYSLEEMDSQLRRLGKMPSRGKE